MTATEPIQATQAYCDFAEKIAAKRTARELKYATCRHRVALFRSTNTGATTRARPAVSGHEARHRCARRHHRLAGLRRQIVRNVVLDRGHSHRLDSCARELATDLLAAADEMDAIAE